MTYVNIKHTRCLCVNQIINRAAIEQSIQLETQKQFGNKIPQYIWNIYQVWINVESIFFGDSENTIYETCSKFANKIIRRGVL